LRFCKPGRNSASVLQYRILDEYCRVVDEITKKRPIPALSSIFEVTQLHSEMVALVSFASAVCSDPDDDKFLEQQLPPMLTTW
jgi:hypothetical protein